MALDYKWKVRGKCDPYSTKIMFEIFIWGKGLCRCLNHVLKHNTFFGGIVATLLNPFFAYEYDIILIFLWPFCFSDIKCVNSTDQVTVTD